MNEVTLCLNQGKACDSETVTMNIPNMDHLDNKQCNAPTPEEPKEETLLIYDRPIFRAKKYELF